MGILGTAPTSAFDVIRTGEVEIWSMNNGWQQHPEADRLKGVTRWFELHPEGWWRDSARRRPGSTAPCRS